MRRFVAFLVALVVGSLAVPSSALAQEFWVSHPFTSQITVHDASGKRIDTIRRTTGPASMTLSPDGKTIAVVDFLNGTIDIYDADRRVRTAVIAAQTPYSNGEYIAFTPDGRYLWYDGGKGIEVYSVPDYQHQRTLAASGLGQAQFATDGTSMYVVDPFTGHIDRISSDGRSVRSSNGLGPFAFTGGVVGARGKLWVGNASTAKLQSRTTPSLRHAGEVRIDRSDFPGLRLEANPSGTRLINLLSFGQRPSAINTTTGRLIRSFKTNRCAQPTNGDFLDDSWVVVTCFSRFIGLFNVDSGAKRWISIKGGGSWDVVARD